MNREYLISLIAKYLVASGYVRSDNYKTYSMKELYKTCQLYNIYVTAK